MGGAEEAWHGATWAAEALFMQAWHPPKPPPPDQTCIFAQISPPRGLAPRP